MAIGSAKAAVAALSVHAPAISAGPKHGLPSRCGLPSSAFYSLRTLLPPIGWQATRPSWFGDRLAKGGPRGERSAAGCRNPMGETAQERGTISLLNRAVFGG